MYTENCSERRTYEKFDNKHYLLYLNEQPVKYSLTSSLGVANPEADAETVEEIEGFSYTGNYPDGGTLIEATEADYDQFVSGLIRVRYTEDQEHAIKTNLLKVLQNPEHERAEEFNQRWEEFVAYQDQCKDDAKKILNL